MVATPRETLTSITDEACDAKALTVNKTDAAAYHGDVIKNFWSRYSHPEGKHIVRTKIKEVPKTDTLERLNVLSKQNLRETLKDALEAVDAAKAVYSDELINHVIDMARRECRYGNLSLAHTNEWADSAFANESDLQAILDNRSLRAPSLTVDEPDYTMVFFHAVAPETPLPAKGSHFRLNNLPEKEFRRGIMVLNIDHKDVILKDRMPAIGGNHMEAAWMLTVVNNALQGMVRRHVPADNMQQIDAMVKANVYSSISEIMLPNEVSLEGHIHVQDGKVTEIERTPNAQRHVRPQRRDITPSHDNPDLRRTGRTRAKQEEE